MGRIIGLDLGSRRIGVAVSDELGVLATPRGAITRRSERQDMAAILDLLRDIQPERVVVGHPIGLSGASTAETERAERFAVALADDSPVPVELWDERLTTREAQNVVGTGRSPRETGRRDAVAAAFLLQHYLNHRARSADS